MTGEDDELPTLTPEVIEDDEALAEVVDEVLRRDPAAREQAARILEHQDLLRDVADPGVWSLFLELEAVTNERFSDALVVVAKWAFTEGRRFPASPAVGDRS